MPFTSAKPKGTQTVHFTDPLAAAQEAGKATALVIDPLLSAKEGAAMLGLSEPTFWRSGESRLGFW